MESEPSERLSGRNAPQTPRYFQVYITRMLARRAFPRKGKSPTQADSTAPQPTAIWKSSMSVLIFSFCLMRE
jgi:hypothetical protein